MTTKWTKEEVEILRDNKDIGSLELSKTLLKNRTKVAITKKATKCGIIFYIPSKWTKEEVEILKNNYKKFGAIELSKTLLKNRTRMAVLRKADNLGLKLDKEGIIKVHTRIRLDDKKEYIIHLYVDKGYSLKKIAKCLNLKRHLPILAHFKKWDIKERPFKWIEEEIKILKENYKEMGSLKLSETLLKNRSKTAIMARASIYKIKVSRKKKIKKISKKNPIYLKLENRKNYIIDLYLNKRYPLRKIANCVGLNQCYLIVKYLKKWGVKKRFNLGKWTEKDEKILKENYKRIGAVELSKTLLKNKGIIEIRNKAYKFKVAPPRNIIKLDNKKDYIINLYVNKRYPLLKIAKCIGLNQYDSIKRYLKKWGVKKRLINAQGGKEWTKEEIKYLKENYYLGEKVDLLKNINHNFVGIMHKAHRLGIKRSPKFKGEFNKTSFNKIDNPSSRPEARLKSSKRMKEWLRKNPDKMLNRLLKRNCITSLEKSVMRILKKHNLSYKYNMYVKTKDSYRFPDFRIGKLIIECDGKRFHNDKEKEVKRDRELIEQGFEMLHFSEDKINKNILCVEGCILKKLNQLQMFGNKLSDY